MGSSRSFCSRREAMVTFWRPSSGRRLPIGVMLIYPPVPLRLWRIVPVSIFVDARGIVAQQVSFVDSRLSWRGGDVFWGFVNAIGSPHRRVLLVLRKESAAHTDVWLLRQGARQICKVAVAVVR